MKINDNGLYREATPDEITEFEREQEEAQEQQSELSPTERICALEATTDDMILLMAELIGGD